MRWHRRRGGLVVPERFGLCAFQLTGLVGFGGGGEGVAYDTFNPSNRDSDIALSNGDLTATITSQIGSVLSITGKSTGKWYFEYLIDSVGGTADRRRVGVADSAFGVTNDGIGENTSWAYKGGGDKKSGGSGSAFGSAWGAGDVIGVALDMGAGKVWFALNNAWQASGDPAAGTNEAFSGLSGTVHFGVGTSNSASFGITVRTNPSTFSHSAPSGFTAGWPAA